MLMLVVLAIIVIQAAVLIVSPLFFSLNLLIGLLGLLTRRARKRGAGPDSEEGDTDP